MSDPSDEDRAGKRPKPTPVREMAPVESTPAPTEPDLEEAEVSIEGETWAVRVLGRSGGERASATPLLLLGFWEEDPDAHAPDREALIVGRTLAGLTPAALRSAFDESEPPRERPTSPREERGKGRGSHRSRGSRGKR